MNSEKKSKGLKILGISMIVIAAILTGVFLGAWAVGYDYNHLNACAADVNSSETNFESSNIQFTGTGYSTSSSNLGVTNLTQYDYRIWYNSCRFKIRTYNYSYHYSSLGTIQSISFSVGLSLSISNESYFFYVSDSSLRDFNLMAVYNVSMNFVWGTGYSNFGELTSTSVMATSTNGAVSSFGNTSNVNATVTKFRSSYNSSYYVPFYTYFETPTQLNVDNFGIDFTSCYLSNYSDSASPFNTSTWSLSSGYYNYITYIDDSSGFKVSFALPVQYSTNPSNAITNRSQLYYNARKYYFRQVSNPTESQYYNQGYEDGYNAGVPVGYDDGYSNGVPNGYNQGYNVGFTDGVESSNEYTFMGLIGAVIDVPVRTFTSLFNFTILGVNLKDFLLGLFGIAIVITILRFVLVR